MSQVAERLYEMERIEKREVAREVYRFNWAFVVVMVLAALADVALIWGFAHVLKHLKAIL